MGLYVGGTAIGGMAGRVITGVVADLFSWRVAIGTIGVLGILSMLAFRALLPPSRHFVPRRGLGFTHHRSALLKQFTRPGLPLLFLLGFVLMGSFVTLYNYIGYRLLAPPYQLNQTEIGAIFVVYLTGVVASPWSGRMADTFGRARVLTASLLLMVLGLALTHAASVGGDRGRHRVRDVRLFRRTFGGERLGRTPRQGCQRSGRRPVSARVLHRLERGRLVWRPRLGRLRMERCRGTRGRAARHRTGCGDALARTREQASRLLLAASTQRASNNAKK